MSKELPPHTLLKAGTSLSWDVYVIDDIAKYQEWLEHRENLARLDALVSIRNIKGETIDAWASPAHQKILDDIAHLEALTTQKGGDENS